MTRELYNKALSALQQELLLMGSMVEEAIHFAVDSLAKQDLTLAEMVIAGDDQIDRLSLKLEEDCVRLIALQQPIAKDLRVITTVLKTVTDLERIADHATNIAEIALRIGKEPLIKPLNIIPKMAELAQSSARGLWQQTQLALQGYLLLPTQGQQPNLHSLLDVPEKHYSYFPKALVRYPQTFEEISQCHR